MQVRRDTYANIKKDIQPGDVIAFAGEGLISELIRLVTESKEVSHVGVVLSTHLSINGESEDDCFHLVAEANASGVRIISLCSLLSEYDGKLWWLPLSCESRQRLKPNLKCFHNFLLSANGSRYDLEGAIMEGLRELIRERNFPQPLINSFLDRLLGSNNEGNFANLLIAAPELGDITKPEDIRNTLIDWCIKNPNLTEIRNAEDAKKYFCSELVTHALQLGGVFGDSERIDPETVNPLELCQLKLYKENYVIFQRDEGVPRIEGFNREDPSEWRR